MSSPGNLEPAIRAARSHHRLVAGAGGAIGRQRLVEGGDERGAGAAGGQGAAASRTRAAGMHQVDAELPDRAVSAGRHWARCASQPSGVCERHAVRWVAPGRCPAHARAAPAGRGPHDRAPTPARADGERYPACCDGELPRAPDRGRNLQDGWPLGGCFGQSCFRPDQITGNSAACADRGWRSTFQACKGLRGGRPITAHSSQNARNNANGTELSQPFRVRAPLAFVANSDGRSLRRSCS